jgi:primosomal protein N' (replication factor Y)
VVGARSALFLPLDRLGLIVVDEEHDHSFKQEDGVLYHARDMAVLRAQLAAAPAVLASATPSLETVANVASGRYASLALPDRHGAELPEIAAVDLRRHPPPRQRFLSPPLVAALSDTLAAGEQAMLFLNRRGYAPLTLCRTCGHRMQCPHCSAWLVEHRLVGRLICHHCGQGRRLPESCPSCGTADSFAACGPGVERLAEEAALLFPDARRAIMASDQLTGAADAAALVRAMAAREIDLLIGTQMVAKGHNFPGLALVGVVDGDLGLDGGDLRAGERTYQLLHQVAGRAGRAGRGRVLLQTASPDHPVIAALVAADRDAFYEAESEQRRLFGMPPFGRLAALILAGRNSDEVDRAARLVARAAPQDADLTVLGPAPAPMSLLRGRHRRRLLLKAPRERTVQPILHAWLAPLRLPSSVRLTIDIDPYSFM